MRILETNQHLFQPTRFRSTDELWHQNVFDAFQAGNSYSYNPASVLSVLSFGYVCGDDTLLREISRQPWLSEIEPSGAVTLTEIPKHGQAWKKPAQIAEELHRRLLNEAAEACSGRDEIYVLLSGGLDSRIIAGILAELKRDSRIATKPVAVSWGHEDSRDVVYGRDIAKQLNFDWQHIALGPEHLMENVSISANRLGALTSPVHLHRMPWFSNVSPDSLVLAGSYGDSIGRAEFAGKSVLELTTLKPADRLGLLSREAAAAGSRRLKHVFRELHDRGGRVPAYVHCEHEQQCHYMRGLLADATTIINDSARVYQLFTQPSVYGYMWSIHPSCRTDLVYAELLDRLGPELSRRPWARTNRALRGRTIGARNGLRMRFADYKQWISGPCYDDIRARVEPQWFADTGLFDGSSVERLGEDIRRNDPKLQLYGNTPHEIWIWLASLREFAESVEKTECSLQPLVAQPDQITPDLAIDSTRDNPNASVSKLRRKLRENKFLHNIVRRKRLFQLRQKAKREFPPTDE